MISPEVRNRYIVSEGEDPEVAVLLLDIVLGYGAHMNMAGALGRSIKAAKSKAENRGQYLAVVGSVCGTMRDPQDFVSQVNQLKEAGVAVMPSNAQAARFAGMIASRITTKNSSQTSFTYDSGKRIP
jgi:FdrA protein